jgi:hypothetical protein
VGVRVDVGVLVGVRVAVRVGVIVGVGVRVGVGVAVGVFDGVRVLVRVGVAVGVFSVPLMFNVKLPLLVPAPSTTTITLCPADRDTVRRDRVLRPGVMSSLHPSSLPEQVPWRIDNSVSKLDPSVDIT